MAKKADWMKRNREEFNTQLDKVVMFFGSEENRARIGLPSTGTLGKIVDDKFFPAVGKFKSAFAAYKLGDGNPEKLKTALDLAEKEARDAFRMVYRAFLQNNPLVTDVDLVGMEMPKHPTGERTPSQPAQKAPGFTIITSDIRQLGIRYFTIGEEGNIARKPDGQHGVEVRYGLFDEPRSVKISDLVNSVFGTKPPVLLEFGEEDRGKHVYVIIRWESTRGAKSIFSPIQHARVP